MPQPIHRQASVDDTRKWGRGWWWEEHWEDGKLEVASLGTDSEKG